MKNTFLILVFCGLFAACDSSSNRSTDKAFTLKTNEEIRFPLDSLTGQKPQYIQVVEGEDGNRSFTFFNSLNHSLYFYDFDARAIDKIVPYEREGPNGIARPTGYHIINEDSIYIFNILSNELIRTNSKGESFERISMIGGESMSSSQWALLYPQFFPQSVTPFISNQKEIIVAGSYMWAIPDSIISTFKFTANINLNDNSVQYQHGYPSEIFGSKFNWDDPFYTTVHYDLNSSTQEMIYSFPITHDLYVGELGESNLRKVESARDVKSILPLMTNNAGVATRMEMTEHVKQTDIYGGIKYDPHRNLYYRLLKKGINNVAEDISWQEKPIIILILDENLEYVGEYEIGLLKDWNTENMLVTKEGLLIEYLGSEKAEDEDFIIFKLFEVAELLEE